MQREAAWKVGITIRPTVECNLALLGKNFCILESLEKQMVGRDALRGTVEVMGLRKKKIRKP